MSNAEPEVVIEAGRAGRFKHDSRRLNFIDSLRGLAALYVLVFHIALVPEFKPAIPDLISPIVLNGATGVALFFVISAFTLCLTFNGKASENLPRALSILTRPRYHHR